MPLATVDGIKLHYIDTGGDGPAVVLLHAFPLRAEMWERQIDALRDRWRVIAPDLKGFGGSDAPENRSTYSMDAYAGEVKALLDELGIDEVVLVGLSMGGYVAFAFLRRYPQAVRGLVLADTRAEADPPEAKDKRSGQQKHVLEHGTQSLIDALPGALLSETTLQRKADVVETAKTLMDNPRAGFIGALEAMKQRPDSTGDLTGIRVPTLVIVGENDTLTPPAASRSMHEAIGGSRLVSIPEAGHLSNLEAPEAFNAALTEFLSTL